MLVRLTFNVEINENNVLQGLKNSIKNKSEFTNNDIIHAEILMPHKWVEIDKNHFNFYIKSFQK